MLWKYDRDLSFSSLVSREETAWKPRNLNFPDEFFVESTPLKAERLSFHNKVYGKGEFCSTF